MVLSTPQLQNLTLHLVIEKTDAGQSRARVLELPDCVVEAATDEQAIEQLQAVVSAYFAEVKVMPLEVAINNEASRENPWIEFIGMYEGDADFAEIARELRSPY
ncbi:MAG: hypothetical protein KME18_11860 [Phormidium tanganyikae FI6-MK23]|jgi:hypothetical protein|nr:hypothetical protein [Phormidium tanganyikae FI6-MK23]